MTDTPSPATNPIEVMRGVIVDPMPTFVTGGIDFTLHSMTAEINEYNDTLHTHRTFGDLR